MTQTAHPKSTLLPPLDIEDYSVESLFVKACDEYDADKPLVGEVGIALRAEKTDDPDVAIVGLKVSLNSPAVGDRPERKAETNSPYVVVIEIKGRFRFPINELAADQVGRLLAVNAPAMLFGIARGIVGNTTGSSRYGRMLLPPVNFVELAAQIRAKQRKTRETEAESSEE